MAIDRRSVVSRHDVVLDGPDAASALTVGNGDFACTVDITGMQTFRDFHDPSLAGDRLVLNTCTQTTWGWHEMPNPEGFTMADAMTPYDTNRGQVHYPDKFDMWAMFGAAGDPEKAAGTWLHMNPQRLDLGRVGLVLRPDLGAAPEVDPDVLMHVEQRLHLWSGTIHSTFEYVGQPVEVTTAAHPERAEVVFRIRSPLLTSGLLEVGLAFPYASDSFMGTADWESDDRHSTVVQQRRNGARILRTLDATTYTVGLDWNAAHLQQTGHPHRLRLRAETDQLELVVAYADGFVDLAMASVEETLTAAARWWDSFWQSGAAIDFADCTNPLAHELERRVVLSQYLTAVNCSGAMPPQETGLVTNSWAGKFHLEMHWWHAAHFALWGRPQLLAKSLGWYRQILPGAQAAARAQGYQGARWPKQVGPEGRDSPNETGPFLIWQQPHILYFAELLYRHDPSSNVVSEMAEVVRETARFMASFVEERHGVYHLPPPLIPAQESYDRFTTEDPTFELAYWWWGLEIAQRWRQRLGQERNSEWTAVQDGLARPHRRGSVYTAIASDPYLRRDDHPSLLAGLGLVPATPLIDPDVMRATLDDVLDDWDWDSAWGWDFPVLAMTAARVGDAGSAVDALLMDRPKNAYLPNGHNPQRGNRLPVYLPGNGGLLAAVSLMVAGWEGGTRHRPGFADDGSWAIEHEGFTPWPS